jgi:hypothetical protein
VIDKIGLIYAWNRFPRFLDDRAGLGYLIVIAQDVMRSFLALIRRNNGIERSIGGRRFVFEGWFE